MNVFTSAGYVLMRIAQEDGEITHKALAEEMGVTTRYVAALITGLLNEGALLPEGGGRRRRVHINHHYRDDMGFALMFLARFYDIAPATLAARRKGKGKDAPPDTLPPPTWG